MDEQDAPVLRRDPFAEQLARTNALVRQELEAEPTVVGDALAEPMPALFRRCCEAARSDGGA